VVTISAEGSTSTLPTGRPVELRQVLSGYVELSQPATKRNLDILAEAATDAETKEALKSMANTYKESILDRRISVLDLLCTYPSSLSSISLSTFLNMVPAMRVRQYSISSSPLWNPSHVTLTVSILNAPSVSGSGEQFMGVGSTFLGDLLPGDLVQMVVRPSAAAFSLPADSSVPLVLFCAGTGLAPMRGFIQERAIQVQSGRKLDQEVGKVLLFFGCRDPDQDFLYSSDPEWKKWVEMGVVDVPPSFSRAPDKSLGCRYVQDRIIADGEDVSAMFKRKAKVSVVCGLPILPRVPLVALIYPSGVFLHFPLFSSTFITHYLSTFLNITRVPLRMP
jgi:cytochrome P450 / NADPH-cytochrome P450 reductase